MTKNEEARQRMGARIAELRKRKGMTQTELAEKAGLFQGHIARLEAGAYGATVDVLSGIAEALGARLDMVEEDDRGQG